MNNDVAPETKISILQRKITMWQNTHYSAHLDAQVAQSIEDNQMLEQAKDTMKKALRAQDKLKTIMDDLAASSGG